MYRVESYYDGNFRGLENSAETPCYSDIINKAHEWAMRGSFVRITNTLTGNRLEINPDDYKRDFDGEFPYYFK